MVPNCVNITYVAIRKWSNRSFQFATETQKWKYLMNIIQSFVRLKRNINLPPVNPPIIWKRLDNMNNSSLEDLNSFHLWNLFLRQRDDMALIQTLNKIRLRNYDDSMDSVMNSKIFLINGSTTNQMPYRCLQDLPQLISS